MGHGWEGRGGCYATGEHRGRRGSCTRLRATIPNRRRLRSQSCRTEEGRCVVAGRLRREGRLGDDTGRQTDRPGISGRQGVRVTPRSGVALLPFASELLGVRSLPAVVLSGATRAIAHVVT